MVDLHPRLSVSALSSWQWSLERDLAFWAEAGIDHVGVWADKLDDAGWDTGVARIREAGLRVGSLIGAGPFTLDQPDLWPAERARLDAMFEAAAALDAGCVAITSGPARRLDWDDAASALAAALGPALDGRDRPLAVEHTNSLRPDIGFLHTLRDAVDFARMAGVSVCMECNACWAERGLMRTLAESADAIAMVQVDDFVVGTTDTPNRVVPGDGDIPLREIMGALIDAGYSGVFELEVVGPRIEEEGYPSAIKRSVAVLSEMLTDLGA